MSRQLVGVDGCPDGWLCVVAHHGSLDATILPDLDAVLGWFGSDAIITIDVPIGLTDAGARQCDLEARKLLKPPRASSVFPAPIRPTLSARTYLEACDLHVAADGRRMSKQAYAITAKIAQVDVVLRADPTLQRRVREVHPEVCFAVWNGNSHGDRPMLHKKGRSEGRAEREALIEANWPGQRQRLSATLRACGHGWHQDDLNDAFAALWTAQRVAAGCARVLPQKPPVDRFGLTMEIVA
jgi:predicted RNase H-like nuclease